MTSLGNNHSIFTKLSGDPSLARPNPVEEIDITIRLKLENPNCNGTENSETDEWFRAHNTDVVNNEAESRSGNGEWFRTHTDDLDLPKCSNSWMNRLTKENIDFMCSPKENNNFRSPSRFGECEEKFSFNSWPMKESKKMFACHPLEGCICDVCSSLKRRYQLSYVRKVPCIPAGSIVVLKGNLIGIYHYFGHQQKFKKEMISDRYHLNNLREVGHNIRLFNPEATEIFAHCDSIEAVYIKDEEKRRQQKVHLNIPQFYSQTLTNNPLHSKHANNQTNAFYGRQKSCRSYSSCDYSGNLLPTYSGRRRYSEYSDLANQDFCNSPNPVFDVSTRNGSGPYVFNSFDTDV